MAKQILFDVRAREAILDPTKVARFALQIAASVASLMLSTEAMVAEKVGGRSPAAELEM